MCCIAEEKLRTLGSVTLAAGPVNSVVCPVPDAPATDESVVITGMGAEIGAAELTATVATGCGL
jgi:hypothetical protein